MDLLINLKYWIFLFLIFFSLSQWFSFSFPPKIYSILKMFLLGVQNNYIEFIWRRTCPKINQVSISCLWLVSRVPKSDFFFFFFFFFFFLKFTAEQHLFYYFGFSNRIPYGLEEPRELWILISEVFS